MRRPLGTDSAPRELAGGKVVQGIYIMQGSNGQKVLTHIIFDMDASLNKRISGQQVPVQLLGLV